MAKMRDFQPIKSKVEQYFCAVLAFAVFGCGNEIQRTNQMANNLKGAHELGSANSANLTGLLVKSTGKYFVGTLRVNASVYTDRAYVFTSIPTNLDGLKFIQPPNADKSNTDPSLLSFNVSGLTDIFIAYDVRATSLPAWLQDWQRTGDLISTTDVGRNIYRKTFPAGKVVIGGNAVSPMIGARSNYNVILKPLSTENKAPIVHAGVDQVIPSGAVAVLTGSATDDGLPSGTLSFSWQKASGPGDVTFSNPESASSHATFSVPGDYSLTLSVSDGEFSVSDQVNINVSDSDSPELIGQVSSLSGAAYEVGKLALNSEVYIDRSYVYTKIPSAYVGSDYILTKNGDKARTEVSFLSFHLHSDAEVYIAYDIRAKSLPTWLNDFAGTGETLTTSDVSFQIFKRSYPAGSVVLGGNLASPAAGASSHYIVFAKGGGQPVNEPPVVNAGVDTTVTLPAQVLLSGSVSDDGLGLPEPLVITWDLVSGPADVLIADRNVIVTTVSFSAAGIYTFRLTANDGILNSFDDVVVTVKAAVGTNQPPVVHAGPDRAISLSQNLTLIATASDDGLPNNILAYKWSKNSGPGTVTFGNSSSLTTQVNFNATGVYELNFSASDGLLSASDTVQITVQSSTTGPLNGQIVVDPQSPSWFKYHNGGSFFMCGPGDPEGFLYRGTRLSDGTRLGDQMKLIQKLAPTGANSIYLMAVRSHGGDGNRTENPFIENQPTLGLNHAVLDQWEVWFTAMDQAGIVIFFIFYDDNASVWKTGDVVGPEEHHFIQTLVNRFKHHKHLIWMVSEEYSEAFTKKRVSNLAALIRATDEHQHPIAVFQLSGLVFDFPDDPNIDQFAIQYNAPLNYVGRHNATVQAWSNAAGRYNLNYAEVASGAVGTGETARKNIWGMALGGAYVMQFLMDIESTQISDLNACGYMVDFFERIPLTKFAPRDDLKFGQTEFVLAEPAAHRYAVYSGNASSNLGLKSLSTGSYRLEWLDTANGAKVIQSSISVSGGDTAFTKPSSLGPEVAVYVQRVSGTP